jgi:hypothetical protein
MTVEATAAAPTAERHVHWLRWLFGALLIVVIGAVANLLGWDIAGWFEGLWDTLTAISLAYLLAALALKTVQTTAVAFAYFSILRVAYPDGGIRWLQILAAYATSVALNSILPANLGTLILLVMFTIIIPGASFAGALAVYGVQKIFFVVIGAFPYLYLFLTVGGSFDIKFKFVKVHPWAFGVVLIGGVTLIALLVRMLWPHVLKWWKQVKEGGQILAHPRAYFGRVFLPEAISWVAGLGDHRGVSRCLQHPGQLPHCHARRCGELDRECDVRDAGRCRCQPGVQRRGAEGDHEPAERDCVLDRPAARDDRLEPVVRDRPHALGVRLERRPGPRHQGVQRRKGETGRTQGGSAGEEGRETRPQSRALGVGSPACGRQ